MSSCAMSGVCSHECFGGQGKTGLGTVNKNGLNVGSEGAIKLQRRFSLTLCVRELASGLVRRVSTPVGSTNQQSLLEQGRVGTFG
jgi:hypothetical protein